MPPCASDYDFDSVTSENQPRKSKIALVFGEGDGVLLNYLRLGLSKKNLILSFDVTRIT